MPRLKPRPARVRKWPLRLYAGSGASVSDFFVLGHSPAYDEHFGSTNPPTYQSPTSRFTHVLHFVGDQRDFVHRIPDRLLDNLSLAPGRTTAAGFPRGIFEIDAQGVTEVPLAGHAGVFSRLWSPEPAYLFASGIHPFIKCRVRGTWYELPLPDGTPFVLSGVAGLGPSDVYVVGERGTILRFDGQVVRRLVSPTNRDLYSVIALDDARLCVGGAIGTLLMGNRKGWRSIDTGTHADLHVLTRFQDRICWATPGGVYAFDGKRSPVRLLKVAADWVSGVGDQLMVSSGTDAWLFDGSRLRALDTVV